MLTAGSTCFLAISSPQEKRVLHPGLVQALKGNHCVVAFEEPLAFQAGEEVTLAAEWRNKLHQQGAKVVGVRASGPLPIVEFERVGEPVNCEGRSLYRVSVALQRIPCRVDEQHDCLLADVSAEGVAVITSRPLQVGALVALKLEIDDLRAEGTMRVQTEKQIRGGKLRYGLLAVETRSPLRKSLESISMMMQRRQLKRQSGAA
jgi:hypothetical protein